MDRSWWEFWQNVGHWRRQWQTPLVFLLWESHEQHDETRRQDTARWTLQVSRCPICYWKEQRNSSRKNEEAGPKCRQLPVVAVSARESKLQCYKEQCCTGTRNVRSMNQGELDAVKQKTARVNTDILGISELNWMVKGKFHSDDHYIHHCRQESLRRNGVALIIDKRTWNAALGCNLKNDRMTWFLSKANHSTPQ